MPAARRGVLPTRLGCSSARWCHVSNLVRHSPGPSSTSSRALSSVAQRPRAVPSPYLPRLLLAQPNRHALPLSSPLSLCPRRQHVHVLQTVLLPPAVFVGLLAALWTWKCTMMVVFQNRIIYMPGLPPNARREEIADHEKCCGGVRWDEAFTKAQDGKRLALCVAEVTTGGGVEGGVDAELGGGEQNVYVLYFQGNASSMPPRLPDLSAVLLRLQRGVPNNINPLSDIKSRSSPRQRKLVRYTMVCLSYRGYWKSSGRPSERGIRKDAQAALDWILQLHRGRRRQSDGTAGHIEGSAADSTPCPVIVWGQSVGAGFATQLAAATVEAVTAPPEQAAEIRGLVLETPFLSMRAMLEAVYPQRWLPYRHLWPFLRNHLDNREALRRIAAACRPNVGATEPRTITTQPERPHAQPPPPSVLILDAGNDELVPSWHADALQAECAALEIPVERRTVLGAYHSEAMLRSGGKDAVAAFVAAEAERLVLGRDEGEHRKEGIGS